MATKCKDHAEKESSPARVDRAVWEEGAKGPGGVRRVSVAEKMWKGVGRNQGEMMSVEKFW